jgi:hypothetical protein
MIAVFRLAVALACAAGVTGCVTPAPTAPTAVVTPVQTKIIPEERVKDAVTAGKSTKAEVIAALGETQVIIFDSGFEVWVYRLANDTPVRQAAARSIARAGSENATPGMAGEFVILFAPSGLVAKTRMRPAPQPRPGR